MKKLLLTLTTAILLLTCSCAQAFYDEWFSFGDWFCVPLTDETALVVAKRLNGKTEVIVPEQVEGYIITGIGEDSFIFEDTLTSVILPGSITHIEQGAFYKCTALKSINIPDGVTTIGDKAFYECASLENISLPATITTMGYDVFYGCSALTEITVTPNSYAHQYCIDNNLPFVLAD